MVGGVTTRKRREEINTARTATKSAVGITKAATGMICQLDEFSDISRRYNGVRKSACREPAWRKQK